MIVQINLDKCLERNISIEAVVFLTEIYQTNTFTKAMFNNDLLQSALDEGYLLSTDPYILSEKALDLIGVKGDNINPKEFINIFPNRVKTDLGYRAIRPLSETSLSYKKLENSYLEKVHTIEEHQEICANAKVYVDTEMKKNKGFYIPTLTNIIAESKWDYWDGIEDANIGTQEDIYESL